MKFSYREVPELPRLAWCARIPRGGGTITVIHGSWVEARDGFFAEGAWGGDFSAGRLADATAFFGSGGIISDDAVFFATATHTYERLQSLEIDGTLLVSNSLAFLLSQADDTLDPGYPFYDVDLMSFKLGLKRARRTIPTDGGRKVNLHYCCNFRVDSSLRIRSSPKHFCEPFRGYAEYIDYLRAEVRAVCANASDRARVRRFEPLTSVSAGYDSPAASLFARDVGCTEAITFTEARPGYGDTDDSGTLIGNRLGLSVHEYSRTDYLKRDDFPEAEFLASGTGGEEVVFAAVQELLPGRVLFTGYFGDAAWSRRWPYAGSEFRIRNPAGASFTEFRLRLGFINVAVPVLGFVHQLRIHAIANSDEMRPWWTGSDYDKPIPRRLLQEAGVPGHMFGQTKMAVAQPFYNKSSELAALMRKQSYEDFRRFTDELELFPGPTFKLRFHIGRVLFDLNRRINWRLERYTARLRQRITLDPFVSERYGRPLRWNAYTVHWGTSKVLPRYECARDVNAAGPAMLAQAEQSHS